MRSKNVNLLNALILPLLLLLPQLSQAETLFTNWYYPQNLIWTNYEPVALVLSGKPPGKYILKIQNGTNGPFLARQCLQYTEVELKRQCQYDNLIEKSENDYNRVEKAFLYINNKKLTGKALITKSTSYVEIPITIKEGDTFTVQVIGYPNSALLLSIDDIPQEGLSPQAYFTLNRMSGRAPLSVTFNAGTSFDPEGNPLTYSWDFGDGGTDSIVKPMHIYNEPGDYTAKLTVTDNSGKTSELDVLIIVQPPLPPSTPPPVNIKPIPTLSMVSNDPSNLRLIHFSALGSTDPDGNIVKYEINFGDGKKFVGSEVDHLYPDDGTYIVTLKVLDDDNAAVSIQKSLVISGNLQLVPIETNFEATYWGSMSAQNIYPETPGFSIEDIQYLYKVTMTNGDGIERTIETCTGTLEQKIVCNYNNLVKKTYISLNRVDWAHFYVDGKRLTLSTSINKNNIIWSTYIKLKTTSKIETRLKGWPTASVSLKLEKVIPVLETDVPVLMSNLQNDLISNISTYQIQIADASDTQTEVLLNGASYAIFPDKNYTLEIPEGTYDVEVRSKDRYQNQATPLLYTNVNIDKSEPTVSDNLISSYETTSLPQVFTLQLSSGEALQSLVVNGEALQLEPGLATATKDFTIQTSNPIEFAVEATDLAGNKKSYVKHMNVTVDGVAPTVLLGAQNFSTPLYEAQIPITITEANTQTATLKINGQLMYMTGAKNFVANVHLNLEGINTFEVESVDGAGNRSAVQTLIITRDSTPPMLTNLSPANGSTLHAVAFQVSGQANEPLLYAKVNDLMLTLSADKKSFVGTYISEGQGPVGLVFSAKDLLGNLTVQTVHTTIDSPLLVPELVSVIPDPQSTRLIVVGAINAARPGLTISARSGFLNWNSGSTTVNADGSFVIYMDHFNEAVVKIVESTTSQAQMTVTYGSLTTLSGIVKDSNGNPLPSATVKIKNTNIQVVTNESGAFSFTNPVTGDQTLLIDGTTIPDTVTGPYREFSIVAVSVNVGLGQNNVIERPIYLTPTFIDGNETEVHPNQPAVATNPAAPGVQLSIPANTTVFPDGSNTGDITMSTINADYSTIPVPANAQVNNIVTLEPSGLKFTEPVEVTLPNDGNYPAGTNMIILSLNSEKGIWEIDGAAEVAAGGGNIVTKPGQGIKHFSSIYAIPTAPVMTEVRSGDLAGIDTTEGSFVEKIQLPTVKALGQAYAPSLTYKSGWAKPTAVVTNIFDIPIRGFSITRTLSASTNEENIHISQRFCGVAGLFCDNLHYNYLKKVEEEVVGSQNSTITPNSIRAQFYLSTIKTDSLTFSGSPPQQPSGQTSLQGAIPNGSFSTKEVVVNGAGVQQLPQRFRIAYATDLKNPETDEYLESGIYPSLARFEVKFNNTTVTSATATIKTRVTGSNYGQVTNLTNVLRVQEVRRETQLLEQVMPQDINSNLVVMNQRQSSAGVGWKIDQSQRILNTSSKTPIVVDSNGNFNSYAIATNIQTILSKEMFDRLAPSLLPKLPQTMQSNMFAWGQGVEFRPNGVIVVPSKRYVDFVSGIMVPNGNGTFTQYGVIYWMHEHRFFEFDTKKSILENWQSLQQVYSQNFIYADPRATWHDNNANICYANPNATFTPYRFMPMAVTDWGQFLTLPSGVMFATDKNHHSVHARSATAAQDNLVGVAAGGTQPQTTFNNSLVQSPHLTFGPLQYINRFSNSSASAIPCTTFLANPSFDYYQADGNFEGRPFQTGFAGDGIPGAFHYPSASETARNNNQIYLNSPSGLALSSQGFMAIADTGNNRVRAVNLQTNTINTIAGNGTNIDLIADGQPLNAGVYHPRGLVYDPAGNLFISTERGYILKLDTNNILSVYAGLPLDQGGTLTTEGYASTFAFNNPYGMVIDSDKSLLYIADTGNHRVVQIDMVTKIASVVVGTGTCNLANLGDGDSALNASLCSPLQLGLDESKNLLIQDSGHEAFRKVTFNNASSTLTQFIPSRKDNSKLEKDTAGNWTLTYRDGSKANFESSGYQVSAQDRVGRTTSYEYDAQKNLKKIIDPVGQTTNFNYSGGKLTSIVDPANRTTSFQISSGRLNQVTFPNGSTKQFTYNSDGLLTQVKNERGLNRTIAYNPWSRLESITEPDQSKIQYSDYKSASASQSLGTTPQFLSNGFGSTGTHGSLTDAKGETTEYLSDFMGYISRVRDPLGRETVILRDNEGKPTKVTKSDGSITTFQYDPNTNDLLSTTDQLMQITESQTYNSFGQVLTKMDGRQNTVSSSYDADKGLLLAQTFPNSSSVSYTYNSIGLPLTKTQTVSGSLSLTTNYEYDARGNVTKTIDSGGKEVLYTYDLAGNVLTVTTKPILNTTSTTQYEYDNLNRLTKVISPKNEITQYAYLPTGQLATIVDPNSNVTTFEYDQKGRLSKKTDPQNKVTQLSYDANNNLIGELAPGNSQKTMAYDQINRLTSVQTPDDLISYTYDIRDEVNQITNNVSQINIVKDSRSRLTYSRTQGLGELSGFPAVEFTYDYDNAGNRISTTADNLSLSYTYDNMNRLTSMTSWQGLNFNFSYDLSNRLTQISRPGSLTALTYTSSSNLALINHSTGSFFEYSYDNRNFPLSKRTPAGTLNYGYDSNGQVTSSGTEVFTYDGLGNRITDDFGNYVYDQSKQQLTEDYKYFYSYDPRGNLISKIPKNQNESSVIMTYSALNQLTRVQYTNGALGAVIKDIRYFYDGTGRRLQKTVVDSQFPNDSKKTYMQKFVYDNSNIAFEYDQDNTLLASHTHSLLGPDDILSTHFTAQAVTQGLSASTGNVFYLKDHLGSVTDIVTSSGTTVQKYTYSVFGKITSIKNGADIDISANPTIRPEFAYTGREFDEETGNYYYRARYYDANIGRFLQKDPDPGKTAWPSSLNSSYIYVGNMPTISTDPSGKFAWLVPLLIGAAVGGTINAAIHGWTIDSFLVGAVNGLLGTAAVLTGSWLGATIGGALASGTAVGTVTGAAIGGATAGGAWGYYTTGSALGAITGATFGFLGGSLYGASVTGLPVPWWTDIPIDPPIPASAPSSTISAPAPVIPMLPGVVPNYTPVPGLPLIMP